MNGIVNAGINQLTSVKNAYETIRTNAQKTIPQTPMIACVLYLNLLPLSLIEWTWDIYLDLLVSLVAFLLLDRVLP